jgi:hypothetical protein
MLDAVAVVFEEGEDAELFDLLKVFVGMVELVGEEAGQIVRSVQVWDDADCTTRRGFVPV